MVTKHLFLYVAGHIPNHTSLVDVTKKDENKLKSEFPKPLNKMQHAIHLVLYVAAATEEPPENLMKAIKDATRCDQRGMLFM